MNSVREVTVLNKIYILSFTAKGFQLSEKILKTLEDLKLQNNEFGILKDFDIEIMRVRKLKETVEEIFKQGNVIVFIGAMGIAVRSIAKYIEHKTKDPAVLVIDEKGEFVIPILSGHIGRGNEFAMIFTSILRATPVITTATDVNNVFSIDVYARENRYYIFNPENIKNISSSLLENKEVGIYSEYEILGKLPKNILKNKVDNIENSISEKTNGIYIGLSDYTNSIRYSNTLVLKPKVYHIGMGCKKNTSLENIESLFLKKINELNIDINLISSISSIDIKKEEKGLIELSQKYNIPFVTYNKKELEIYENLFEKSEFVKKITGVSSVCETSAYLSSKEGEILLNKTSDNGVTIAITKEDWKVKF